MGNTPEHQREIIAVILSGIFGIASSLIPITDGWFQRRGHKQRLTDELELARKEIDFWKYWMETETSLRSSEDLAESKQIALANLATIAKKQEIRLARLTSIPAGISHAARPLWQRIFLLYSVAYAAWFPRALYFSSLCYLAYSVFKLDSNQWKDWLVWFLLALLVGFAYAVHSIIVVIEESRRMVDGSV